MASMSPMGSVSSFGGVVSAKEMKAREKRRREELRAKLSGLPSPQYEYELVAPDVSVSSHIFVFLVVKVFGLHSLMFRFYLICIWFVFRCG